MSTVGLALGVGAIAAAPDASAAGPVPSSTSVTASAHWIASGQTEVLTARVTFILPVGLGVVPTGTVTFRSGTTTLGSGRISCLLVPCTASATTNLLVTPGLNTVTATYSGDLVAAGSNDSTVIRVDAANAATSTPCAAHVQCTASTSTTLTDPSGTYGPTTSSITVVSSPSANPQVVNAAIVSSGTCSGLNTDNPTAPFFEWSSTASDTTKLVTIDEIGSASYQHDSLYNYFGFFGCYSSSQPFKGIISTGGDGQHGYGNAPQVTDSDGTYYQAYLADCNDTTPVNTPPCFSMVADTVPGGGNEFAFDIHTPVGDPKFGP